MNIETIEQYVVDAFSDVVFKGNPAAICLLKHSLPESLMLSIARENRLSETAFLLRARPDQNYDYHIRWFTPGGEIDLCGHATLASAFVILNYVEPEKDSILFMSQSGLLKVERKGDLYEMDFPAYELKEVEVNDEMEQAIGARPVEAFMGRDLVCVLESAEQVKNAVPDQEKVLGLAGSLLHISARDETGEFACISRSFAPKHAVDEDPVCGSAHCHLVPLWAEKLGQKELVCFQASEREGVLYCCLDEKANRVKIAGKAILYLKGEIFVPEKLEESAVDA